MDSFYLVAAYFLLTFQLGAPEVTYHLSWEPDRFVEDTNVNVTFWLEGFTEPVGNVTLRGLYYGKIILSPDCTFLYSVLTCDNQLHKFSIVMILSTWSTYLQIMAVTQNPASSTSFYIKPYVRPSSDKLRVSYQTGYNAGDQVSLSCDFSGGSNNAGYFTWRRINTTRDLPSKAVITTNTYYKIKKKAENYGFHGYLRFQAEAGDEGWYQCLAVYDPSEEGEFVSDPIYVNVIYPPQMNLTQPYTIYQEANVGEKVTLVCSMLSNPEPDEVLWFKAGSDLPDDPRFEDWQNEIDNSSSEYGLEFTVTEADYGPYNLIVSNMMGRGHRYFILAAKSSSPSPWMSVTIASLVILVLIVVGLILLLLYTCRRAPRREETSVRPPTTTAMDNTTYVGDELSQLPSSRVTKIDGEKVNEIYMNDLEASFPGLEPVTRPPNKRYTGDENVTEMEEDEEGHMTMALFPPPNRR